MTSDTLGSVRSLAFGLGGSLVLLACGSDGPRASETAAPLTRAAESVELGTSSEAEPEAEPKARGPQVYGIMVPHDVLALERLRKHVEAGMVTAQTLARVELAREHPRGLSPFTQVVEDACSIIESGRVAPGSTVEIHIHAGLGAEEPPPAPADESAADVIFEDARTKRRIARMSPLPGYVLELESLGIRIRSLMQWWAQDPEQRDVEIAIQPSEEHPALSSPEDLPYALLERSGLFDRPLLVFPDGSTKSAKEWLGR